MMKMKKSFAVLSELSISTAASAQSGLPVYGVVDKNMIRETGSDVRMRSDLDSSIGFRGV